jgi:hypothetical protein
MFAWLSGGSRAAHHRSTMRVAMLFAVLAACTHHRPLREAHDLVNGDDVVVENHVGQTQPARVVHGPNNELQLSSPIGVLPEQQIARITETSSGLGAAEGLGLGALIGGTIGAVGMYASGDADCEGNTDDGLCFEFSAGEKAVIGGIAFGAIGGLIGLVVGASKGSTTIYEDGDTRITPIAPQGSTAGLTVTF